MQEQEAEARQAGTGGAAAAPGSEPGNTEPGNCTVYRTGVDSLYLSFTGELSPVWADRLEDRRKQAQSESEWTQVEAQVALMGHQFEVSPFGRGMYRYVLQDNAYHIKLASRGTKRIPVAVCQIASEWATKGGLDTAVAGLRQILAEVANLSGDPRVSRVDVFADFGTPESIDWPERAWVKRATDLSRYSQGQAFSGWTFGRGGVMSARLYDKTLQIEKSGQDYLKVLWADKGWNPEDRVYRLEFQFRREMLRQLAVNTYGDLTADLGGLWGYATQEWLRLTIPNPGDSTSARWETHPVWRALQTIPWLGVPPATRMAASNKRLPVPEALYAQLLSLLARYMGANGRRDIEGSMRHLFDNARMYFDQWISGGEGFDERAIKRAAVKAKQYNVPFPGMSDGERQVADAAAAYRRASRGE